MSRLSRETLNNFRTGPLGIALFYGYLIAIIATALLLIVVLVQLNARANEAHALAEKTAQVSKENSRAIAVGRRALCNQKREKKRTIEETTKLLNDPRFAGKSTVFGIDKSVLRRSVAVNRRDLRALSDVKCKAAV